MRHPVPLTIGGKNSSRAFVVVKPPRAQYFVVVGGLACCKDDLGCAR